MEKLKRMLLGALAGALPMAEAQAQTNTAPVQAENVLGDLQNGSVTGVDLTTDPETALNRGSRTSFDVSATDIAPVKPEEAGSEFIDDVRDSAVGRGIERVVDTLSEDEPFAAEIGNTGINVGVVEAADEEGAGFSVRLRNQPRQ